VLPNQTITRRAGQKYAGPLISRPEQARLNSHLPKDMTMRERSAKVVRLALTGGCFCLASGCATIAGGGTSQPVAFSSTPAGATFTVKSSSGIQMAQGTTPSTVRLPRKNEYQVEITVPGFKPQTLAITKGLNGWVWGNLFIGWVPGFIIDFAGGAASKLEPALIQVSMQSAQGPSGYDEAVAVVHLLNDAGGLIREVKLPLTPVDSPATR
jgi:hypothetical protein